MQKAGIVGFRVERLDFTFDIVGQKTYQEIVRFEPTKSFQENRDNVIDCLKQLHKNGMLHKDFVETDLTDLYIEITSTFAENSDALTHIMKDNPFESEENQPKEIYTYKYGNSGVSYETIILEGKSVFVYYDSSAQKIEEQLKFVEQIIEDNRIIKPMRRDSHVCKPYVFGSTEMLFDYFRKANNESLDTLLVKAETIVKRYVIQPKEVQKLLAIDTIWSYFQDIFSTTHYINATGDNNSVKTASGNYIKSTAYRAVKLSDPSATHIFRTLGNFEAGQVVIVLDEAEKINDFPDMLTTLKAGYENGDLIPRSNTAGNFEVEFFYPYSLKSIISEKGLDEYKAKGVLDITFSFNCIPGDPQDTDSIFLTNVSSKEQVDTFLDKWESTVENVEIDRKYIIARKLLLRGKKHYIIVTNDNIIVSKGNEGRKSDRPPYFKKIQQQFELDFASGTNPTINLHKFYMQLEQRKVPLEDLVITMQLAKNPQDYPTNIAQKLVGQQLNAVEGDIISFYKGDCLGKATTKESEIAYSQYIELFTHSFEPLVTLAGYDFEHDVLGVTCIANL